MKFDALLQRLRYFNKWWRGADTEQPDPKKTRADIDAAIIAIEKIQDAILRTLAENRHLADKGGSTHHLIGLGLEPLTQYGEVLLALGTLSVALEALQEIDRSLAKRKRARKDSKRGA